MAKTQEAGRKDMKQAWFTKKPVIFLLFYPVVHCALSYLFLIMALAGGLMPDDASDPRPTLASSIGSFMLEVLWAPIHFVNYLGIRRLPGSDWFWIALTGVLYGWLFLIVSEFIVVKQQGNRGR